MDAEGVDYYTLRIFYSNMLNSLKYKYAQTMICFSECISKFYYSVINDTSYDYRYLRNI